MLRGLAFRCNLISFQIEIGAPSGDLGIGLTGRPVDVSDLPTADLVLCQLRGRSLPVAAATFAELMLRSMQEIPAGQGPWKPARLKCRTPRP
jgi:hypothetical protein